MNKPTMDPGLPHLQAPSGRTVVVIGAGLVGLSCAWLLSRRGHQVLLVDSRNPGTAGVPQDPQAGTRGSDAALGVLMARVFHRSSGRGWRLRQSSLRLWNLWRCDLAERGHRIPWRQGLLLLAASPEDLERQRALLEDPRRQQADSGAPLQHWDRSRLEGLRPAVPATALGALFSPEDGQLDPLAALEALALDGAAAGMVLQQGRATELTRRDQGWQVRLESGERLQAESVVLAAGLGSGALLPGGATLEPVLGQALELEPDAADQPPAGHWPGAVVWRGINLIPRPPGSAPEAAERWRLWLGATLEPGQEAGAQALESLRDLGGEAPDWLRRAKICRRWEGLRAKPVGQPAPLLQDLGSGLLLATGHYRNGVLLAPASAEWVVTRIEAGHGAI